MIASRRQPGRPRIGLPALFVATCAATASAQWGPAAVETARVVTRQVTEEVSLVGSVEPVRRATVGSLVAGRVVAFLVDEGEIVQSGQPIARLRTTNLEIQIARARAELDLRRAELAELENGSRPEVIAQRKAEMEAAAARRDYARVNLDRVRRLYDDGGVTSRDDLDRADADARDAESTYLAARQAHALAVAGAREEQVAQARARVAMQEEAVRLLEDDLEQYTIRAPFDGSVVAEHTEVGQMLAAGGPVIDLVELDQVEVRVFVLEDAVTRMKRGDAARVTLPGLDGMVFEATLQAIVPDADPRSREFPVKVRLDNQTAAEGEGFLLRAGMTAIATLRVGEPHAALMVPKDALVLGGPVPVVCVVDPGDKPGVGVVRHVPVEVGASQADWIEVRGGQLAEGAVVVSRGNERLMPGQEVAVPAAGDEKGAGRPDGAPAGSARGDSAASHENH